jgi:hypothetical protein
VAHARGDAGAGLVVAVVANFVSDLPIDLIAGQRVKVGSVTGLD